MVSTHINLLLSFSLTKSSFLPSVFRNVVCRVRIYLTVVVMVQSSLLMMTFGSSIFFVDRALLTHLLKNRILLKFLIMIGNNLSVFAAYILYIHTHFVCIYIYPFKAQYALRIVVFSWKEGGFPSTVFR